MGSVGSDSPDFGDYLGDQIRNMETSTPLIWGEPQMSNSDPLKEFI